MCFFNSSTYLNGRQCRNLLYPRSVEIYIYRYQKQNEIARNNRRSRRAKARFFIIGDLETPTVRGSMSFEPKTRATPFSVHRPRIDEHHGKNFTKTKIK